MTDVPAEQVMAFRRVTDFAIRECRAILLESGGNIGTAFDLMATRFYFGHIQAADLARLRADFVAKVDSELGRFAADRSTPG